MPIDAEQVRHIAALAQLDLDDPTVERFRNQLQKILDYVAMLDSLDVSSIEPTARTLARGQPLRADAVISSLSRDQAQQNAPDSAAGQFRVPRVLGS